MTSGHHGSIRTTFFFKQLYNLTKQLYYPENMQQGAYMATFFTTVPQWVFYLRICKLSMLILHLVFRTKCGQIIISLIIYLSSVADPEFGKGEGGGSCKRCCCHTAYFHHTFFVSIIQECDLFKMVRCYLNAIVTIGVTESPDR